MAHYRIYLLDDHGKIVVGSDTDCVSDTEAFARAASMLTEVEHMADQTEVWCGARCVGSIAAPTKQIVPGLARSP